MVQKLAVQNTFLHVVEREEDLDQPCLGRSVTAPVANVGSAEDLSTVGEDVDVDSSELGRSRCRTPEKEGTLKALERTVSGMVPQLSVQNTFLHLVDKMEDDQPYLARSVTAPVASEVGIEDFSTDEEDGGNQHFCISRDITLDVFEMPSTLGMDGPEGAAFARPSFCPFTASEPPEPAPQEPCSSPRLPGVLTQQLGDVSVMLPLGSPTQPMATNMTAEGYQRQVTCTAEAQASPPTSAVVSGADAMSQQLAPGVSCTHLPDGAVRMEWLADSRRFTGRAATAVSPAFSVEVPELGSQTFKIIIHAAAADGGTKAGCNFQAQKGHATIELKCESRVQPSSSVDAEGTYVVMVDRSEGTRLGIDLASKEGKPWWVKAIGDGLIMQWNQEHPEKRVSPGDSILEVNGVSGDLAMVREACTQRGSLRLLLQRAPQQGTRSSFDVRFGIGGGPMRGPVRHDFAAESCCGLPSGNQVWDLLPAVDRAAKKLRVVCELAQASSPTSS
mmetsp:Transcript_52500/g.132693  ORF Transcript_52500/g.132693 Transcript_52500/m.132693 type:complete len:502 (-) Transcript_52500:137-1642(-)|eukprot:CAMPEP_0115220026 /NCGR_PEP_ID=MMETSP0270-20121206/27232_1 /TAXON_ID=71861 /ORGANISM="Scrippsiella trochoidea, Strain CCMP3099" /LENGTH=501 /DNA_ID=CAMNT_0002634063 /DNA_START=74 /DNA_END=1579 /DNA_ORIENTATION=-